MPLSVDFWILARFCYYVQSCYEYSCTSVYVCGGPVSIFLGQISGREVSGTCGVCVLTSLFMVRGPWFGLDGRVLNNILI